MSEQETTVAEVKNPTPNTRLEKMLFRFKKDKLGNKRQNVELQIPVPTFDGLVAILKEGGKGLDLLMDTVSDQIRSVVASVVADDIEISQEKLDLTKFTWEAIANMPKEDRRSSSIPAELWEAFCADYIDYMPAVTKKSKEAVTLATEVYMKKMTPVRTNKNALSKLQQQLAIYMESPNAEQFSDILELLNRRTDTYLKSEEPEILAENL